MTSRHHHRHDIINNNQQDEVALNGAVILPHKEIKESVHAPKIIL